MQITTAESPDNRKRLRVLMIGPLPPPVGGMGTVMENLLHALKEHCDLRVLNNVKTTARDRSLFSGVMSQIGLLKKLRILLREWRPEIVHIHTCSWFTFWRNSVDVFIAKSSHSKVILHIHGAEFHKFLASLGPIRVLLARRIFALCDSVVVLGDEWQRVLEKWCSSDQLVIVPNGVSVPPFKNRDFSVPPHILCLGNYEPRKGLRDLITAVAQICKDSQVRLTLLGAEVVAGERQALVSLAEKLGISDYVNIPGPVMGEAKVPYFEKATIFCLPSYNEGLPMAMLESMAEELPVVVTKVGSIPEAVVDGVEGCLFSPGDAESLVRILTRLINDPAYSKSIARAGYERVLRDFSVATSARRLLNAYNSLV